MNLKLILAVFLITVFSIGMIEIDAQQVTQTIREKDYFN